MDKSGEDAERQWPLENDKPTYFVVDDQYPYIHVEVQTSAAISLPVLASLWALVDGPPHCGIGLAVPAARYFYLIPSGIWFFDVDRATASSVADTVGLPIVTSRPAA